MSEYWKSTPNYWCKFCKTYVRDTKLARQQHDATGRHQSNIQRSLRTLHRDQERDEREKQRAKDEVARLNGVVGAGPASFSGGVAAQGERTRGSRGVGAEQPKQATVEERKRQMQQLADMGIAVPEEFRRDMALAGEWQVVSETPINATREGADGESGGLDAKSIGVRKRKLDTEDEEDEAVGDKKPQWGSTLKTYPGSMASGEDFESLLGSSIPNVKPEPAVKDEGEADDAPDPNGGDTAPVKTEAPAVSTEDHKPDPTTDVVDAPTASSVVFKKRKKKV